MSNIATSIVQSRHLLELGLSKETADMFWKYSASLGNYGINGKIVVSYHDNLFVGKYDGVVPAWSLSALLEVMPSNIKADEMQYYHHLEKSNGFYTVSYYFDDVDELYTLNTIKVCDDPVTATYEMVCWLLEQGLIKKGDNDN